MELVKKFMFQCRSTHYIGLSVEDQCQNRGWPSSSECDACKARWLKVGPMLRKFISFWAETDPYGPQSCESGHRNSGGWLDAICSWSCRFICVKGKS